MRCKALLVDGQTIYPSFMVFANLVLPSHNKSLLADGIKVISRTVAKLRKATAGIGSGFVNHTRQVKKSCLGVSKLLKQRISKGNARLMEAEERLSQIAKKVMAGGWKVKAQIEALKDKASHVIRLGQQLSGWLEVMEKIIRQTEQVLEGRLSLPHRLVSIFATGARPIRRGKARAETEFGRKVLIGETDHGIITTYQVWEGNPADSTLLQGAVRGHRRLFRKRLKAVAADRGFYSQANEEWLKQGGVEHVGILVRGKASRERLREQKRSWFKRLQCFRAGSEGKISLLKRVFGLGRSPMRGDQGAEIWVGQGIFAYDLWQAAKVSG